MDEVFGRSRVSGDGTRASVEGTSDEGTAEYDAAGLRAVMLDLITGPFQ